MPRARRRAYGQIIPVAPDSPAANLSTLDIVVTWTLSAQAVSYRVQRSADGATGWSTIAPTVLVATYTDTAPGVGVHYYRVHTHSNRGYSAASATVNAEVPA